MADIAAYLREYEESGEIVIRAKWTIDGCETLARAAQALRGFAAELDALAGAGFELTSKIEDDYGFVERTAPLALHEGEAYLRAMKLTAAIIHEPPYYVARCLEVEVSSQGKTVDEARANLTEALELYFEDAPRPERIESPIIVSIEIAA